MNASQRKANDELTAAMEEFGIEESQLGADVKQQRAAACINVKFTHHAARFNIGLTGHPIRTCNVCGFATDRPEVTKCPNDGKAMRGSKTRRGDGR